MALTISGSALSPINKPFVSLASSMAVTARMTPITTEAIPSNIAIPVNCTSSMPNSATIRPSNAAPSSNSTTNIEGSFPCLTASI